MIEEVVKTVHPNRISFLGGLCSVAGAGLAAHPETDIYGACLIAAGQALDWIDGPIARHYKLRTIEGAKLDPLIDKIKNCAIGTYIAGRELIKGDIVIPVLVGANFIVDYFSQRARGPISSQFNEALEAGIYPEKCHDDKEVKSSIRANVYGKLKVSAQNLAMLLYISSQLYNNHISTISQNNENILNAGAAGLFGIAAIFGWVGILKRRRK